MSNTNNSYIDCHRAKEASIKKEPASQMNRTTHKRKMYSTSDANPIGYIGPVTFDPNPSQPATKRQRVGKTTSHLRFNGVMVSDKPAPTTRATRKSTRARKANSKKDLFGRLGRELQAIVKTIKEIAEALD